ncbi:MAG: hypothetical protein II892_02005 [Fibrobacter sp.]|nr:hypothetical protein [Fibrobacter sp.]
MQTPETSKLLELFSTALDELPNIEDDDSSGLTLEELSSDDEDFAELELDFSLEELSTTFSLLLDSTGFSELEDTSFFSELEDSFVFTELEEPPFFIELDDLSPGSVSLLLLDFADFSELEEALLLSELDDSLSLAELEGASVVELDKVSSTLEEDSSAASTGELSLEPSSPQALPSNAATTTIPPRTNFFSIKNLTPKYNP